MSSNTSRYRKQPRWKIFLVIILIYMIQVTISESKFQPAEKIQYSKTTYTYKVVDYCQIKADIYRPDDQKIRPVFMWIHGGALIIGNRSWLNSELLKMCINEGFTVVSIDYRLAPETKLDGIIKDVEDAYQWLRSEGPELFYIDPDYIVIGGASAGGYLTLTAGFRVKPHPKALVSFYGYGNISGDWYAKPDSFYNLQPKVSKDQAYRVVSDSVISATFASLTDKRHPFYLYCRQNGFWPQEVTGHDPRIDKKWFAAYEPIQNITPGYPPTILLHGQSDTDVPFQQSLLMSEELRRKGIDHELISNPEWGHGFDGVGKKDPKVAEALERILIFLNKYVVR